MRGDAVDKTCLSWWFPRLLDAALPVPRTVIVDAGERWHEQARVLEDRVPDFWCELVKRVTAACEEVGVPAFLRTGQTSAKHSFKKTCRIEQASLPISMVVESHMCAIIECSEIADMMGLPYRYWVAREWLNGPVAFTHKPFGDMPVRREFRCFVSGPEVVCVHGYWPLGAFRGALNAAETASLAAISEPGFDDDEIARLASRAGAALGGDWSIDLLATDRGWFVTDCAEAGCSYHWPGCKNENRWRKRA